MPARLVYTIANSAFRTRLIRPAPRLFPSQNTSDADGRNVSLPTLREWVIAAVATEFAPFGFCATDRAMPP
jgi:hypothetical protein